MAYWKGRLRSLLNCAGKGDQKVACVFGVDAQSSYQAVLHLRAGAPGVPIWLFTTEETHPETFALCERIYTNTNGLALVVGAQRHLWPRWVAITAGTWVGRGRSNRGAWALKLAPLMTPPFRIVILNKSGGFFSGTPANIALHCWRTLSDSLKECWASVRDAVHEVREASHDGRVAAQEELERARQQGQESIRRASVRGGDLSHGVSKLLAATGLRLFSTLLRWIGNPHRHWFKKLHGKQPLILDVPVAEGCSVVRFQQRGDDWDGEALEKLARSSEARWVLWQSASDPGDLIEDSSRLFEDARTLAVSRQGHFRGWKPFLAATAPFRTLQPNEASRVHAPMANTMLVDRAKLLALGVPRCSLPGEAWLILFWKAAAAGFRSYSLGQASRLCEQPEAPIQEASFVLSVLEDPALGRLCPRQEELSRGNIAFAPMLRQPPRQGSERLKVLIVSPFLPYPLSHGGAVRIFNLCRALSDRVDFSLIAMREAKDVVDYSKLHQVFKEVYVVDKDVRTKTSTELPEQVSASESASLRALISQVSQRLLPHLIQFEYTHFAGFRDAAPGVPAILVEHDLTFTLYRQLAEANPSSAAWREYERWRTFESKWLGKYEGVWTVSDEDRAIAMRLGGRSAEQTFLIANGVDIERFQSVDSAEEEEIFYVGSFRHLPNIIGFEKLYREVMPRVWRTAPGVRLRVVAGPDHEFFWRFFGRTEGLNKLDPRIEVHGFVEDLRPMYARAAAVAVPLEVSAGTNIKILEAMACGKAIVTTPVGCSGLGLQDGYQVTIRKDWGEFSDALCQVLSDEKLRSGLGKRARRTVEDSFSWTAIAERAYESYQTLVADKSPVRAEVSADDTLLTR